MLRDDMLGCLGVLRDTQLHMCSYLRGGVGMGRQPQIPGQWVCQSCGMGGCVLADAAKLFQVWCASARRDWWPKASEGDSLPWTTKQPGVAHQSYEKGLEELQW